jgi:predicted amidohydrolase YtcJ
VKAVSKIQHGTDTIILNGNVITMDDTDTMAEAVLIRSGKIVAVGKNKEVTQQAQPQADIIDAKGATVLPGLLDTHPHLLHYGSLEEPLIKLWDCTNHDDIVEAIKQRAAIEQPGTWLQTTPVGEPHFFHRRSYKDLAEGILPGRHVLDRASTDHPVVIQAWGPTRPNCMALNTTGLRKLDITRDCPDRIGNVWIEKDTEGEPTGILTGSVTTYYNYDDYANKLWRKIPFLQNEMLVPGTQSAISLYHQQGVTGVFENHMMDKVLIDAYRQLRSENKLQMRVLTSQEAEAYGMPWSKPRTMDDFKQRLEEAADSIDSQDSLFRFNGISMMWDGYCFGGSQMMRMPYLDVYGCLTHGHRHITLEKAEITARFCAERKLGLNILAMGIAAHDEVLELMERLAQEYDIPSLNWVLVHATTIEPEQVARYKRLNFSHTTSMTFCWGEGALIKRSMGDKVLDDMIPLRQFFDNDIAVGGSSDWGPKNVWEQIELSLTHEFGETGFRNLGKNQKVSRVEALSMFTRDAAKVMKWQEIGAIAQGKQADLVIVDRDPLTCEVDALRHTRVLKTLFDGDTVFCSGDL